MKIPFNKPSVAGNEIEYISRAIDSGKISGDGGFTDKCHAFFESRYVLNKVLLTSSCTDALEMCAILADITPEDEVIIPSYTFVSTANAFVLRGAKIVFADSMDELPNIDVNKIEELITSRTKAIALVHYAGIACQMDEIMAIANRHNLLVVEDAAQAIEAHYKGKPLGSIGALSAFSFHETKNIISGEGGMICINDKSLINRAEVIREKGTNRPAFFRGEVEKYNWVDIGSSFLPSELTAAFLYGQLEKIDDIQNKRKKLWDLYNENLKPLEQQGKIILPLIPSYASNNAHTYYILCKDINERTSLAGYLKENGVLAVFHYLSLHRSPFYESKHDGRELPNSDRFSNCLLRLPMYYSLKEEEVGFITDTIKKFYSVK